MASILTVNARSGTSLVIARDYLRMTPKQFRQFIRAHHSTLVHELARKGIAYQALGPALVPSRANRHEMALLFNVDSLPDMYGYAVAKKLIPLLDRESTSSVLHGDISLLPTQTRALANHARLVPSDNDDWGQQYVYCVYLNNLSLAQRDGLDMKLRAEASYLGYVPTTYKSRFRTVISTMLPTGFIKHKNNVLLDNGVDDRWVSHENEIGFPFADSSYEIVSVNSLLYSPLLSYKIQSEMLPIYREDVLVSLNAISDKPLQLSGFDVLLPAAKFGYLRTVKGDLLRIARLDKHSREGLASVIRAELDSDYIYRLQDNPDGTVQFSIVLELPREEGHPAKVIVGLKYCPDSQALRLVTLT